ncbi:MAG: zf-HC2 domain-containing protein [Pirellula sp.]|jgi:Putative zinc-finger
MMNCDWVEEQLSAYIDNELGAQERLKFESHCDQCDSCRGIVAEYQAIGTLMRKSEARVDTNSLWERVEHRLDVNRVISISTKSQPKNWVYAILASAASVALIWFVARNPISNHFDGDASHEHAALAVDFQEIIRAAKSEPKAAIAKLVSKYQGKELDAKATASYLGYEPAIFKSVPKGFTRVSTHVLNMPCCKCSASICERNDGTSLIVFEHKDEQPVWFGELPSIETQCSGKSCKIIEAAGQLAVSWKNDDRQLTMIGANDIDEVNQWVASMKL